MDLNTQISYCLLMSNIIANLDINEKDKETLLLLLQDRDRNYIRINNNSECFSNICKYLEILKPLKIPNNELVRIGDIGDGGYVMYNSLLASGGGDYPKAISLGVSDYSPWDLEMAQRGYRVLEYDGSIDQGPYDHPNIIFHKKFVGLQNSDNMTTLEAIIESNELDSALPNILQIDIENAEWDIFERIDMELIGRYFSQVVFEFHGCNPEEMLEARRKLNILEKINRHYQPIHFHFNNHGKIFYCRNLFFSVTLEVSYLRRDISKDLMQYGYRTEGILDGLDFPVHSSNPEIPVRFCW